MEKWKVIAASNGAYEVSSQGRVKSLPRVTNDGKNIKAKFLNGSMANTGYIQITLRLNGRPKMALIHRLVANAFIQNPALKPQVNHINGIKTDNRIENLEWVDWSENQKHAYDVLKRSRYWLGKTGALNHHSRPMIQSDLEGNFIKEWSSQTEAAKSLKINRGQISRAALGKIRKSGGFKWQYV